MTRKFLLFICALIITGTSFGQLTGIKSIPGTGGPNDYTTIAAAIADLNLYGVGPGGVTFNIAAGHTETFPSPTAGLITATGTASKPVVFQKSGTGANPVITAGIGTTTNVDGIIVMAGGDYITFDGIDLIESPANTNATTQMEFGFAMVKARNTFPVDGCQHITIRNCSISLNPSNIASSGIYSGNHISTTTSPAVNGTLYTTSDYSNNCKFYSNTITNVFKGFNLNGYNDNLPGQTSFDQNTEIGIEGFGNTITQNVSANSICYGIYADKQTNLKIVYNTISGYNAQGSMYGITPRISNNADIHHNTISVSNAAVNGNYGIDLYGAGSPGYTTEVHNNLIQNCTMSGGGGFNGIYGGTAGPTTLNIYTNTITGITATTGGLSMISLGGGGGTYNNIYGNLIYNNTKTGPGSFYGLSNINYKNCNIHDNQIYSNNIIISGVVSTAATLVGIQSSQNGQTSETIYNNMIYDLNISGTSTSVSNALYGISTDILPDATRMCYNNMIYNLNINTPAGSGTVSGLRFSSGSTSSIYKNQVFNLQALNAAGVVNGIQLLSGTEVNVYNNFISDLKTPSSASLTAVSGILIAGGTKVGAYYNTVFLNASSSESTFGTSGIYKTGATTMADLRNNVIMNTSIPGTSGGATVAYRWSGVYNPAYYATSSNANNFYAGTPAANRLVFYDGTNSDLTFADYQARVSPRDALSFSENSPLVNSTAAPYNLHMNTSVPTLCQNGGIPVTTPAITDDFDGHPRSTTPDVGADEFAGTPLGVINPTGLIPGVVSSRHIDIPFNLNPSGDPVVIVWNTTGSFSTPAGTLPPVNGSFAGGTLLYNGITSPVGHSGLTGGTTYYYKAFSYTGSTYSSGVPASAITSIDQPSPFVAYATSSSQIDLSWTKNALSNDVIVAVNNTNAFGQPVNGTVYTPGSALPTAGTVLYVGPLTAFNHAGLTVNTKYYYKAWSLDEYKWYSATGSSVNATTFLCAPTATLPFTENFDTYTPPAIGCGTVIDANNDGTVWGSFSVSASTAHSGTKVLSLAPGAVKADDWYFIRGLNLVAGKKYFLSFYYRAQYTYPSANFEVKWGTSPTPSGMFDPALFTITTPGNFNPYPQASCYITAPATGTYYFGWHATENNGMNIYIDDISITTSDCASPLSVNAGSVTANSASISWTGDAPNVQIDYGTAGHVAGAGTVTSTSVNPTTLTGLTPATTYDVYVRKDCGLASYSFWTGPVTFTTAYQPPVVITEAASALTGPEATLNASVNAGGISTRVFFEYGLTTDYGSVASVISPVTGTATSTVGVTVTGLISGGTVYHYRAVGYNNGNYTYGNDQIFSTPSSAPAVVTTPASLVSSTGATLNGIVNANNASSVVTFEYGATIAYGTTVTATVSTVNGLFNTVVDAPITGLIPGTVYNYRVNATNATGTSNGANLTFTAADLPTVSTTSATWGFATATTGILNLNGTVNANGTAATVSFQYGLTEAYGTTVNAVPVTVTGTSTTTVTTANITLSTSSLNQTIHYRIVATNSTGTVYGSDMTIASVKTPTVTTVAATFPATGVTLNSNTGANNANTTLIYEYGITSAFGSSIAFPSNPITGTSTSSRPTVVTGLLPATLYYFRPVATNAAGTTTGATMSFTTPVLPTSATTLAATLITATGGKLNGTVVTTASTAIPTDFRYEYGLSPATMTIAGLTPTPNRATANGTFAPALTISGLIPNTTYYYRVYAYNASGRINGETMSFTTLAPAPTVTTLAAYGITPAGAILNGTVNANNQTSVVTFEYGLTTAYGSTVTPTQSPVDGIATVGANAGITGLLPNTLYHYRINATNATGTTNGTDMTFTTLAVLPVVASNPATLVTTTEATLNGTVNPGNSATVVSFEYGLTTAYGSVFTATPSTLTGTTTTPVLAALTGLIPNTTYHFRCVGVNNGGTAYGIDQEFTTPCLIPVITISGQIFTCAGSAGNVYTTEPGNFNYIWTISAGGTITSGAGTNMITVTWNTTGYKNVSVNCMNIYGCWPTSVPNFNVIVSAPLTAGTISANQTINYNTVPAPLTGTAPTGGLSPYTYQWQSSLDGITFNDIAGAISLNYAPGNLTVTTHYRLTQTSGGNCGTAMTNVVIITVNPNPVPPTSTVQNVIVGNGQANCYNATQTIFIAGSGTAFVVQNGGSATMIAGQNIIYYPGTTVEAGGYMHGYIAPGGPWCTIPSNPVVNNAALAGDVQTALPDMAATQSIKVYPNPTNGSFTIELSGATDAGMSRVEIIGMSGIKAHSVNLNGERKSIIGTENLKPGIYFIQVTTGNTKETLKLIKM